MATWNDDQMTVKKEVEGIAKQRRRGTGGIDNIGSWTDGGMTAVRKRKYLLLQFHRYYGNSTTS